MSEQKNAQIERIAEYEEKLDRCLGVLERLRSALDGYFAAQDDIRALERYYLSPEWRKDFEDDEAGKLPKELKRGVLSEDGIDHMLEDDTDLYTEMMAFRKTFSEEEP